MEPLLPDGLLASVEIENLVNISQDDRDYIMFLSFF